MRTSQQSNPASHKSEERDLAWPLRFSLGYLGSDRDWRPGWLIAGVLRTLHQSSTPIVFMALMRAGPGELGGQGGMQG